LLDFNFQIQKINLGAPASETGLSQLTENLINHMTKVGRLSELAPIFTQLTSKGDDKLTTLSNLVLDLKTQLVTDQKVATIQERKQEKLFQALKKNLDAIIVQLNHNIQRTKSQIISMTACVANEKVIMYDASSKKHRNSKLLKLALITCKDFAKEFVVATKGRKDEIAVIGQIIQIVKKRFGEIDPTLLKNLNNLGKKFTAFVNATEFKKYQDYVKVSVADNMSGKSLVVQHSI